MSDETTVTLAEEVACKLGWMKRDDGFWTYPDIDDRVFGVGFTWGNHVDREIPTFRPDIWLGHTAYVKRNIESRGLCWGCVSPMGLLGSFTFSIIGLNIHVSAETEEMACCQAFLKIKKGATNEQ